MLPHANFSGTFRTLHSTIYVALPVPEQLPYSGYATGFDLAKRSIPPVLPTNGGNRGSLPQASSVRGAPNNAGLVQIRCVRQSHPSLASLRGWFAVFLTEVSLLFRFAFMLLSQIMHNYLTQLLHSLLAMLYFSI